MYLRQSGVFGKTDVQLILGTTNGYYLIPVLSIYSCASQLYRVTSATYRPSRQVAT